MEVCGRKLRDVARVCQSKAKGIDVCNIPESAPVRLHSFSPLPSIWPHRRHVSQEIEEVSSQILTVEEVLLKAPCFDFVVDSPHADLIDVFNIHDVMLH
jgi:hypothetical protein